MKIIFICNYICISEMWLRMKPGLQYVLSGEVYQYIKLRTGITNSVIFAKIPSKMVSKFVLLVGLVVQAATLLDAAKRQEVLQSQCETPSLDSSITKDWVESSTPSGGWYFPMFSKSNTKASPQNDIVHNILVPHKYSEKEEFCPRVSWDGSTGQYSFYGKKWATFKCFANGTYTFQQCTVTTPDNEEEPEKVNVFLTLSDNQSYIFIIRCWDDGHQDWSLATLTGDKVSETIKERVLDHADSLGFDREAYHEISYEKCSG